MSVVSILKNIGVGSVVIVTSIIAGTLLIVGVDHLGRLIAQHLDTVIIWVSAAAVLVVSYIIGAMLRGEL